MSSKQISTAKHKNAKQLKFTLEIKVVTSNCPCIYMLVGAAVYTFTHTKSSDNSNVQNMCGVPLLFKKKKQMHYNQNLQEVDPSTPYTSYTSIMYHKMTYKIYKMKRHIL